MRLLISKRPPKAEGTVGCAGSACLGTVISYGPVCLISRAGDESGAVNPLHTDFILLGRKLDELGFTCRSIAL